MNQSKAILLVSSQGPELQKIIRANSPQNSLVVDLLLDDAQLFRQLSQQSYALLVIDSSLLAKLSESTLIFPEIEAISPNTATLLLAAGHERHQAIKQLQQGAADYLLFPIDASELLLKIERVLEIQALKYSSPPSTQLDATTNELLIRSANLAAVGQLIGSVAHQINNPLTVTMTNSQLLLLETNPNSEAYELATDIFKAGERIQDIVKNLLEFSNQETYFFTQADLIETIEGALALVIRSLKKDQIEVVKDYQARATLSASVSHLKLVWMSLLLNACDAVLDSVDQPQITISTSFVSEREVKIAITDNGSGIAEKDFEQLFRPFFTTKPPGRFSGLGLYSAHAIIERHNGQIKVFSQPGVATTFEVILPLDNPRDL